MTQKKESQYHSTAFNSPETTRNHPSNHIPDHKFRFVDLTQKEGPRSRKALFAEILRNPLPINGIDNPIYNEVEGEEFNEQFVLEKVATKSTINAADSNFTEKQEKLESFKSDAQKLVEIVKDFEADFRALFENTAIYDESKPFTASLVFDLREFLIKKIPEWYPVWDCNPFTAYSHDEQVMNFKQRTMKHIDCNMLYIYEYVTDWNGLVQAEDLAENEKTQITLDPYFMMCRALLHDLGRWFTQDSRAHEEIPAIMAEGIKPDGSYKTGIRRVLLTLDDGDPATHPRFFDLSQPMSIKSLVRTMEFQSDFYSKPHNDYVWPEVNRLLIDESNPLSIAERWEIFQQAETRRQKELRYPELALMYFLYSGRGYKDTSTSDIRQWHAILKSELENNPAKLKYLEQEAIMIETSKLFLQSMGMNPSEKRSAVMRKWELLDADDKNFLEKCFPELVAEVYAERAARD